MPELSQRDKDMIVNAFLCRGPNGEPNIEILIQLCGWKNKASGSTSWGQIKKRVEAYRQQLFAEKGLPLEVNTPKKAGVGRKRKPSSEDEGDDGVKTIKPSRTKKSKGNNQSHGTIAGAEQDAQKEEEQFEPVLNDIGFDFQFREEDAQD